MVPVRDRRLITCDRSNSPVQLIDAIASSTNQDIAIKNKLTINDPIKQVPRSLILINNVFSVFTLYLF